MRRRKVPFGRSGHSRPSCARYNLACYEGRNGRIERAVKHWNVGSSCQPRTRIRGVNKSAKGVLQRGLINKVDSLPRLFVRSRLLLMQQK
eukprot:scaffold5063_cov150-Skeletonema_menzelii.AAC.1